MEQASQFVIREASVEDTEAVRRVQAESWLDTYPNDEHGVSYEWVKEYTDTWLTPEQLERSRGYIQRAIDDLNGFYRVAERSGEIVGFVHAATNEDDTKELEAIYLHPSVIGSGIGHQLAEKAIDWAGGKRMGLEVAVYNDRAIRFYEKHGFKLVEGTEYLYRDKIPVIKMERRGDSYE